jgi:hypothetical protein
MGFTLFLFLLASATTDPELSGLRIRVNIRPSRILSASAMIWETSGASVRA